MLGLSKLREVIDAIGSDLAAARDRDPAARGVGSLGILLSWPGVQAVLAHRIAHGLWQDGVPVAPRTLAYLSRATTGIEIHPAAVSGSEVFVDHGAGVVLGETVEIGDRVTVYQGVTLGGTGFARGKRHPTIGDDVTIGSGAKLLGPIEIGSSSKVGANAVVIDDVPAHTTIVGNPGRVVQTEGGRLDDEVGVDWADLPDPVADALREMGDRIAALEFRLDRLIDEDERSATATRLRPRSGRGSVES
ncbi:MAG: serine O-acetyltransferase EpsC [bacterium]